MKIKCMQKKKKQPKHLEAWQNFGKSNSLKGKEITVYKNNKGRKCGWKKNGHLWGNCHLWG